MDEYLRFAILGLGAGSLYGLVALALVVTFRGSGTINFAQGAMGLMGTLVYYELQTIHGWPVLPSIVLGMAASGAIGAGASLLVIEPLQRSSALSRLIGTIGLLIVLESAATIRYGNLNVAVDSQFTRGTVRVLGGNVGQDRFYILVIGAGIAGLLWALYRFTPFGLRTAAVSENRRLSVIFGYHPKRIATANWALGGALTALAGILLVPITGLNISQLTLLTVPALAAALAGRMTSFPVTFLAGLAIAIAQSLITRFGSNLQYPFSDIPISGAATAVPFIGILIFLLAGRQRVSARSSAAERLPKVGTGLIRLRYVCTVAVCIFLVTSTVSSRWIDALTVTTIMAVILLSFVVVTGYTGQLSLAQLTLAGLGAFIPLKIAESYSVPWPLLLLIAGLANVPVGLLVGLPALRTRGASLAVVTLGMAVAVDSLIFRNPDLAGSDQGLVVAAPTIFGWTVDAIAHPERYLLVCAAVLAALCLMVSNVRRSRVGRRLLAVRSNERAAASLGIGVRMAKLYSFGLSAAIAGVGGLLLVSRNRSALFDQFSAFRSAQLIANAAIGGVGFILGPILGGTLEPGGVGSAILGSFVNGADRWLFLLGGVLLIAMLLFAPDGLAWQNIELVHRLRRSHASRESTLDERFVVRDSTRPAPAHLEVEAVSVWFGGVQALSDVSIAVAPGTIVGLIGANGAGKTTCTEVISGFVRPATGSVRLGGVDVGSLDPTQRARMGIARSFQSMELFEDMTVGDNLLAAAERRDVAAYFTSLVAPGSASVPPGMIVAITEFDLEPLLDKQPSELSFATRRLVSIARAVVAEPSVLLLDEPAAGLDDAGRSELERLLRRLATDWGLGILLIEHDVELVMRVCDEVVVLDTGRVIASGNPEVVRRDPAVIGAYLGEPLAPGSTAVAVR